MSLGFLTESALVPSKATEIKVDNKSLVDLKAIVFQKEEERKRRLQDALAASNDDDISVGSKAFGKYARLRGKSKRRKQSEEERIGKNRRNSGVDARNQRDEEAKATEAPDEDDDAAWSKKSAEMLRKKAELYEKMVNGTSQNDLTGEYLVDFEAKKRMAETGSTGIPTTLEIIDEFGRTRNVAMESDEYTMFAETQAQHLNDSFGGEQQRREGENRSKEINANGGSFVISQWEKRLKSTEKLYLKEVHEQATFAQSLVNASTGAIDKKTRKQLRLERLRKEQEEAGKLSNCAPSGLIDTASSEKATEFLNQLSSLM